MKFVLVLSLVFALGFALGQIPALRQSHWWYPEAGFREFWTLWWLGLFGVSLLWRRRTGQLGKVLTGLWLLTLLMALSGFANLVQYVATKFTVGDLLYNHFLGAQRAFKGAAIYDVRGLHQSVNASPFVIALLKPFGFMKTRAFLPYWLGMNVLMLFAFFFYAWLWMRWLWTGRLAPADASVTSLLGDEPVGDNSESKPSNPSWFPSAPGLPELGILVVTTLYFNSFQRSWRLGQLDTGILLLLAVALFHLCWYLRHEQARSIHLWVGGIVLAFAVGVKLVPVLALGPLFFWWLRHRKQPGLTLKIVRLSGAFGLGLVLVVLASLWGVGTQGARKFVQNMPKMAKGSTAGVNYAVVGRFAKYRNSKLRLRHHPLPAQDRKLLWPMRIAVLLLWAVLAFVASQSMLPLLLASGVVALPTISPMCWDIYYIWCANFPLLLVFAWMGGFRPKPHLHTDKPPAVSASTQTFLDISLWVGAFYLMGLAGNSVIRDIHSLKLVDLKLPLWFDEARMAGYALLLVLIVWVLVRSRNQANVSR